MATAIQIRTGFNQVDTFDVAAINHDGIVNIGQEFPIAGRPAFANTNQPEVDTLD